MPKSKREVVKSDKQLSTTLKSNIQKTCKRKRKQYRKLEFPKDCPLLCGDIVKQLAEKMDNESLCRFSETSRAFRKILRPLIASRKKKQKADLKALNILNKRPYNILLCQAVAWLKNPNLVDFDTKTITVNTETETWKRANKEEISKNLLKAGLSAICESNASYSKMVITVYRTGDSHSFKRAMINFISYTYGLYYNDGRGPEPFPEWFTKPDEKIIGKFPQVSIEYPVSLNYVAMFKLILSKQRQISHCPIRFKHNYPFLGYITRASEFYFNQDRIKEFIEGCYDICMFPGEQTYKWVYQICYTLIQYMDIIIETLPL